jgi:hypothetical protein
MIWGFHWGGCGEWRLSVSNPLIVFFFRVYFLRPEHGEDAFLRNVGFLKDHIPEDGVLQNKSVLLLVFRVSLSAFSPSRLDKVLGRACNRPRRLERRFQNPEDGASCFTERRGDVSYGLFRSSSHLQRKRMNGTTTYLRFIYLYIAFFTIYSRYLKRVQ